MGETRKEKIQAMLAEEPEDVFLRYSLALETAKEGNLTESLELLDGLTKMPTPYVPAFFRSAQMLADEGQDIGRARAYLRDGIEAARTQGDLHAAAEMGELLSDLGQHGE